MSDVAPCGRPLAEYAEEREELEHVGERLALLDDGGARGATVEVTDVELVDGDPGEGRPH